MKCMHKQTRSEQPSVSEKNSKHFHSHHKHCKPRLLLKQSTLACYSAKSLMIAAGVGLALVSSHYPTQQPLSWVALTTGSAGENTKAASKGEDRCSHCGHLQGNQSAYNQCAHGLHVSYLSSQIRYGGNNNMNSYTNYHFQININERDQMHALYSWIWLIWYDWWWYMKRCKRKWWKLSVLYPHSLDVTWITWIPEKKVKIPVPVPVPQGIKSAGFGTIIVSHKIPSKCATDIWISLCHVCSSAHESCATDIILPRLFSFHLLMQHLESLP